MTLVIFFSNLHSHDSHFCGPEVLFETCVAMKFVDDDDDDNDDDDEHLRPVSFRLVYYT